MTYEWSLNEMRTLFSFAPEDTESSDPDVLYRGELIDVEKGGIQTIEEKPQLAIQAAPKFTEISLPPPILNPNYIRKIG